MTINGKIILRRHDWGAFHMGAFALSKKDELKKLKRFTLMFR